MNARVESQVTAVEADVVITRSLKAPRALVFKLWTDPQHLPMWWGPQGFNCQTCHMDVRVGGAFHLDMLGPDGVVHPCDGIYREIVEPERIVYDGLAEEGHPCGAGLPPHGRVTISFTELDGVTTVRIHAKLRSVADREAAMEQGFGAGWSQTLERLEAYVSSKY
ncbi:SRPBCC domain-containing protein [Uliginosibacterium sp. H3]|uniref:SRPBCC domain-containing protein n=1 Tax=Uliginosibacterium silvisoli TaxID=3114758 RepID=A0ABU6K6U9_9RHOO|nr:SRPBCC domain-containing protein [Uliginosibacterium sp. H3]